MNGLPPLPQRPTQQPDTASMTRGPWALGSRKSRGLAALQAEAWLMIGRRRLLAGLSACTAMFRSAVGQAKIAPSRAHARTGHPAITSSMPCRTSAVCAEPGTAAPRTLVAPPATRSNYVIRGGLAE